MDEVTLASEVARSRGIAEATPTDLANLEAALALAVSHRPRRRKSGAAHAGPAGGAGGRKCGRGRVLARHGARTPEAPRSAAATAKSATTTATPSQKQRADAKEQADRLQQKLEALTHGKSLEPANMLTIRSPSPLGPRPDAHRRRDTVAG
jgi:hypothetical protein